MAEGKALKFAVVTGGTRGIGFGIARCLAKSGYCLILGFNANEERAAQAKSELESTFGVKVWTVKGDVAETSTIDALFDSVRQNFGNKLNAFIHNAGMFLGQTSEVASPTAKAAAEKCNSSSLLGRVLNVTAEYDYYQAMYPKFFAKSVERAAPLMKDGEGYIVAISSFGCNALWRPIPEYVSGHAKAAMEHLVRCCAKALASRRITCNCVIPGYTETEALLSSIFKSREEMNAYVEKAVPMKKAICSEDIGNAVAFLCSPKARFITGATLNVDGGLNFADGIVMH